jgi:hypothetical protein
MEACLPLPIQNEGILLDLTQIVLIRECLAHPSCKNKGKAGFTTFGFSPSGNMAGAAQTERHGKLSIPHNRIHSDDILAPTLFHSQMKDTWVLVFQRLSGSPPPMMMLLKDFINPSSWHYEYPLISGDATLGLRTSTNPVVIGTISFTSPEPHGVHHFRYHRVRKGINTNGNNHLEGHDGGLVDNCADSYGDQEENENHRVHPDERVRREDGDQTEDRDKYDQEDENGHEERPPKSPSGRPPSLSLPLPSISACIRTTATAKPTNVLAPNQLKPFGDVTILICMMIVDEYI